VSADGGTPPQRPDQVVTPQISAVAAGGSAGIFRGRLVEIIGAIAPPGSGLFVYDGAGSLIASIAGAPGTDPLNHQAVPAGIMSSDFTIEVIIFGSEVSWTTPSDAPHQGRPAIFANPSGANGNSLEIVSGIGKTTLGAVEAALTFYDSDAKPGGFSVPSGDAMIFVAGNCQLVTDSWHTMPAMSAGWTVGGIAKYRLTPFGDLQVAWQNLTPSSVADGTTIWAASSLPSAYQPAHTERVVCYTDNQRLNGANTEGAALLFGTDGSIQCFGIAAAATRVDLFATIPLTA